MNAASKLGYCLQLLDVLFTKEEIKQGAVEPTEAGNFALDEARIKILKGDHWKLAKVSLNNKCKDTRRKKTENVDRPDKKKQKITPSSEDESD